MRKLLLTAMVMLAPTPAVIAKEVTEEQETYVSANIIGILYHEFGHALIDILQVPVFGQEEDAADVMSVLMVDQEFESKTAESIIYDIAFTFAAEADARYQDGDEPAYWGVHGLDEQRYYNTICMFYGGDVDAREDFAIELELPDERMDSCADERQLADDSWGPVLEEATDEKKKKAWVTLENRSQNGSPLVRIMSDTIAKEINALNEWLKLPQSLMVIVDDCDEANAFYDLDNKSITMCTEFAEHLVNQLE